MFWWSKLADRYADRSFTAPRRHWPCEPFSCPELRLEDRRDACANEREGNKVDDIDKQFIYTSTLQVRSTSPFHRESLANPSGHKETEDLQG
jgi:hypothetical protein